MLGQFQKRDNVLVYYQEDDLQPGIVAGTNADTGNEKLLYTVKVGNKYWVGEEAKLFSPEVSAEEAAKEVEGTTQRLTEEAQQRRAKLEEEQRRLEEATETAEEETS